MSATAIMLLLLASPLVDVTTLSKDVAVDMRYSTADNFMHADLYGDFAKCVLMEPAAKMLVKAQETLAAREPGMRLVVFDCLRPREIQTRMWAKVKGTPQQPYVADPKIGSVHNYGCAVDLSVRDAKGQELDMGTPFDFFGPAAEPRKELDLLRAGKLTATQLGNRLVLRRAMLDAGFLPLPHEWWHFDCMKLEELKKTAKPVERIDPAW